MEKLAIDGGPKVREKPMPPRALFGEEEKQAAIRLFDQAIATGQAYGYNGPESKAYEKEFAEYMGGGFAHAVNSGTTAIHVALGALELNPGDEVIVPPITDPGGVMPVAVQCLVPIVSDSWFGSYNMGPDQIEARITKRTKAIIVAHIGGDPCDMGPIMEIARAHNLYVIEDCAQAHGARYRGKLVGTFGTFGAFSTMFGKHHATGGQGGIVFTRNEELYWRAVRFADRGKPYNTDSPTNVVASLNFNQDEMGCAIGRVQLRKLDKIVAARQYVGEAVRKALKSCKAVRVGPLVPRSKSSYWFLRIQLDLEKLCVDKAKFAAAVAAEGIPVNPNYRHIPSEAAWFKNQRVFGTSGYPWQCPAYKGPRRPKFDLPNVIATTECSFNVGIHERYGPEEVRDIVEAIKKVEKAYLK